VVGVGGGGTSDCNKWMEERVCNAGKTIARTTACDGAKDNCFVIYSTSGDCLPPTVALSSLCDFKFVLV